MEIRTTERALAALGEATPDRDLEDTSARAGRRPLWYVAIVVLDAIAVSAFITYVVIPRLS